GYLETIPEKRSLPPQELLAWISEVLKKGVSVGFLKQQQGTIGPEGKDVQPADSTRLHELSHDSLGEIFRQFRVEYESWIRSRWAKVVGALVGVLIILPAFIFSIIKYSISDILKGTVFFLIGGAVYVAVVWLITKIARYIYELIAFPIIRKLSKGEVPLKSSSETKPNSLTK